MLYSTSFSSFFFALNILHHSLFSNSHFLSRSLGHILLWFILLFIMYFLLKIVQEWNNAAFRKTLQLLQRSFPWFVPLPLLLNSIINVVQIFGFKLHIMQDMQLLENNGHLPDHSSQKGMMSLHGRKFSHAYLLLDARSIHQYILQDNHFCWQGSRTKWFILVEETTTNNWNTTTYLRFRTFRKAPHPATSDFAKRIWKETKTKKSIFLEDF